MKIYPQISLILLLLTGCGRGAVPQTTPQVIHTRDTITITEQPSNDFAIGDDCSALAAEIAATKAALYKCEDDVTGLLEDNTGLKEQLASSGKKVKIKNSYNTDNSQLIRLKNSNQMLAQDNARLKADSAVMADKLKAKPKEVIKKVGNTTHKGDRFWLGVLVATGVFQGLRLAKRYAVALPPPFGLILSKILNLIA